MFGLPLRSSHEKSSLGAQRITHDCRARSIRRTVAWFVWLALLAIAACNAAPKVQRRAPPVPSMQSEGRTRRSLALAAPGGGERVDAQIRALEQSATKPNAKSDVFVLLGRSWIRKARETADPGYYLNARAAAELVLEREPESALAQNLLAHTLLNEHRFAEARELSRKLLQRDAEDLLALGTLADAAIELGRYEEATEASDKLNDLKPNLPAYARTAALQWLYGDASRALDSYRLAIESGNDPNDPEPRCWALVQAGLLFFSQGDYAGAAAGAGKALGSCSDYAPALVLRGRAALAQGQPKEAREMLEKANAKNPLPESAWRLGDALSALGDARGAERAYERVVAEGRRGDKRTLALFLATKNRSSAEALHLAEAEMKVRPSIYTADVLAWALYRNGRIQEAKALAERATRLGTIEPLLLFHAGAIGMKAGERKARHLVERALALSPNFDPTAAAEARALLEETAHVR